MHDYHLYLLTYKQTATQVNVALLNILSEQGTTLKSESRFADVLYFRLALTELVLFKEKLLLLSNQLSFDYFIFSANIALDPKLVVFDMDSTLIPIEVIDQLAEQHGVKSQVAEITESAMQGILDFNQSFEQRLALLKGMDESAVNKVMMQLRFNLGVEDFCHYLRQNSVEIGIASGGFMPFAIQLAKTISVVEIKANRLDFTNGKLSGEALKPIVNAQIKADSLADWAISRGLKQHQTVAIGDGANDLLMMDKAGLGIAYKAKPKVNLQADGVLKFGQMNDLIRLFEAFKTQDEKVLDND